MPDIPLTATAELSVQTRSLNDFLVSVERRGLRMAEVAVGDRDAAFDILQDTMMKLVQNYGDRTPDDWRPLFFRILNHRIVDWHRSQQLRWKVFDRWFARQSAEEVGDPFDQLPAASSEQPEQQLLAEWTLDNIEQAVGGLSARQQQAFMLRCWEGMNTAETATVMDCSEGTVKTLYSRALSSLRETLGEQHHE